MQICIFEDQSFSNFLPLAYFRPVYALRCGAVKLREKIERMFPKASVVYHCRPGLAAYLRLRHQGRRVNDMAAEPTWFINGRVLADDGFRQFVKSPPKQSVAYFQGKDVVAAFLRESSLGPVRAQLALGPLSRELFAGIPAEEVEATVIRYPWELMNRNAAELLSDFSQLANPGPKKNGKVHAGAHLISRKDIVIGKGSVIKPGSVLDAEKGPIIIGENVTVYPHAFIEGPAFVGSGSYIKAGAKIYGGTTIGEVCKVGGEIEASIIHSFSNKQHDGFLGHSYLASWVNIGADTNTSDLKNNYGSVEMIVGHERIDTGMQLVGLFMGDHSKTGINVMFDTGTIVGVSCNIYGAGLPPKFLPSFSWGNVASSFLAYRLDKSLETARRVVARRNVRWTAEYEELFRSVFEETTADRARARVF